MASLDLKLLAARLSNHSRRALEAAASITLTRTNYNVEIEHWLLKILEDQETDIISLIRHFDINQGQIEIELLRVLDSLRTGNARPPSLSPDLITIMEQAWLLASIEQNGTVIRSSHLLWAMLNEQRLAWHIKQSIPSLDVIQAGDIKQRFPVLLADSKEGAHAASLPLPAPSAAAAPGSSGSLSQFTINLTAQARSGKIEPIFGRDTEIRQMIDILARHRQNNPILTGEPGVGKTAIVEGFAVRLANGEVPPTLRNVELLILDLGLLQAGSGVKGEFENRLRSIIDEVNASPKPVILFVDEAHTLIGAGGSAGQNDAANLLKPALARGELKVIAATTWAEYKKYFEKDAALARRFQVIKVEEPTETVATSMIRSMVPPLEQHHNIRIFDEAVTAAVRLSARYIPNRQLPDKAVSLLDTACARVAMSQSTIPPSIEDLQRRISLADTELATLERETSAGKSHDSRIATLQQERQTAEVALSSLEAQWETEKSLVTQISTLRSEIEIKAYSADPIEGFQTQLVTRLADIQNNLTTLQGETPLVFPAVDAQAIAEVVENWTGIPAGRMRSDEIETILNLENALAKRIIGQRHALQAVSQAIRTSRTGLTDPRKPIGVFLMVGTSGVGKTETALALADQLYGGDHNVTVINMTEFKEEHKVSLLMGSPPGYVGYGEGGILTEAVRRRPYSVILLDEMEKAHPGVQDVFFQVFDKGHMKDGEGRDVDFKNTVIIMTSNAGTDIITQAFTDPTDLPDAAALTDLLQPELLRYFKAAFLGRATLVPYLPLSQTNIGKIAALQLQRIKQRLAGTYRANFEYTDDVIDLIVARCTESSSGARNIEKILSSTVLPALSTEILGCLARGESVSSVKLAVDDQNGFLYIVE